MSVIWARGVVAAMWTGRSQAKAGRLSSGLADSLPAGDSDPLADADAPVEMVAVPDAASVDTGVEQAASARAMIREAVQKRCERRGRLMISGTPSGCAELGAPL